MCVSAPTHPPKKTSPQKEKADCNTGVWGRLIRFLRMSCLEPSEPKRPCMSAEMAPHRPPQTSQTPSTQVNPDASATCSEQAQGEQSVSGRQAQRVRVVPE